MFAQVTRLQYWKSEHDEQTCEDAYGESTADGLFAVADGAGTTLFSNIWASILVQSFLATPLMSNDPFEVEWWVRQAQERFRQEAPDPGKMAWNALQKAQNQGSHSTLATLRVSSSDTERVQAELLVFGDSCVLIGGPHFEQVRSFPLDKAADFEQAPICVPSKRSIFHRYFHRCHTRQVELQAADVVVLASDAVSKWVVSSSGGRYTHPRDAFQQLIAQTPDTWVAFISECRARDEMIDDDSTALIITLAAEAHADAALLGVTTQHSKELREGRKEDLARAAAANNKELLAIAYGDGVDLELEGVTIPQDELEQARSVADALQEVLQTLRQEVNRPDAASKIRPVWQKYAPLLQEEPCAATVRQTLAQLGVFTAPSAQPQHTPPMEQERARELLAQPQQQELFVGPAGSDEDKATTSAHSAAQQSLDTENITFSPQEEQRARLAYQQEMARQRIQAALQSMNIGQMAQAYELVSIAPQTLLPDELDRLRLAHTFLDAYRTGRDEAILAAFDVMQNSPAYQFIKLTKQEEERIGYALRRRLAQAEAASNDIANATTVRMPDGSPEPGEAPVEQKRSLFARLSRLRRKGAQHA